MLKKISFLLFILCVGGIFILFHRSPFTCYFDTKCNDDWGRDFIVQAFKKIPPAKPGQRALVLGADFVEEGLRFPLEKGYDLFAIDYEYTSHTETLIPDVNKAHRKITWVRDREFDFEKLPSSHLVMASFILPFFVQKNFKSLWNKIEGSVEPGGYFVGNFFDPDTTILTGKIRSEMIFHTKKEVLNLFKNWTILDFAEVKKSFDGEHYYEIFAQKNGFEQK